MPNEFVFLPWVRTPLVGRAATPSGTGRRRQVRVGMQVVANATDRGTPALTHIDLYDAGDIKGIDPDVIARVEPSPGARGVEPNYFAHVEFCDADFPWRYSLDTGSGSRVTPWLALIALKPVEFKFLPRTGGPLPLIEVAAPPISLPDLSHGWAWAHVQVDLTVAGASMATLSQVVRDDPTAHFARLLCTRRLETETSYYLFLVPVFEGGRLRGMGDSSTAAAWNAFAWTAATTTPLRLPVYAQWSFATSDAEDFESLVRRITPIDLDSAAEGQEVLGVTRIRGGETGHYAGYLEPAVTFLPEGALRTPLADDRREAFASDGLTPRLVTTLNASLTTPLETTIAASQAAEDPLLTLPAYGHHFRGVTQIIAPVTGAAWPTSNAWIHEANLDRRYRIAAGAGARVVRKHQEAFMAAAWAQAGDIIAANRLLAQASTAVALNVAIQTKHIDGLASTDVLALGDSMLDLVAGGARGKTIGESLRSAGKPAGLVTLDERKALAKRPQTIVLRGRASAKGTLRTSARGPGEQPFPETNYGDADVAGSGTNRLVGRRPPRDAAERKQLRDDWGFSVFPHADRPTAEQFLEGKVPQGLDAFEMQKIAADQMREELLDKIREASWLHVARRVEGLPSGVAASLEPIYRGPRIPEPMYAYLAEQSPDLLLPGIADLPYDSAGLLVENRRFIEAYLLGCNHEMNRELLWREYPGDLRGTVFPRFWERGAEPNDEAADDIRSIRSWTGSLGDNAPGARGENIVLVVRGELLRRHPGVMIALNRQQLQNDEWRAGVGQDLEPEFWGRLGDDMMFYGFPLTEAALRQHQDEYFFVIYEPVGRYRFGLDIASHAARSSRADRRRVSVAFPTVVSKMSDRGVAVSTKTLGAGPPASAGALSKWADLSWSHVSVSPSGYINFGVEVHPTSGDTGQWSTTGHSATIASVTFQRPVRVVISALRMIGDA